MLTPLGRNYLFIIFYGANQKYQGIIACSVYFYTDVGAKNLTDDAFLINYKEPPEEAQKRFEPWLDKAVSAGLVLWKENL